MPLAKRECSMLMLMSVAAFWVFATGIGSDV